MTNGTSHPQPGAKRDSPTASPSSSPIAGILSDPEDDLTLRVAMYGVMFQAHVDQVSPARQPYGHFFAMGACSDLG